MINMMIEIILLIIIFTCGQSRQGLSQYDPHDHPYDYHQGSHDDHVYSHDDHDDSYDDHVSFHDDHDDDQSDMWSKQAAGKV